MRGKLCKMLVAAVVLTVGMSSFAGDSKFSAKVADIVSKVDKANDPDGKYKDVKTKKTVMEASIPMTEVKLNIISIAKKPDKIKSVTEIPIMFKEITVFNGKQGWKSNPHMGVVAVLGPELQFLKFSALLENSVSFGEYFEKIELADKLEKVGDFDCFKLTCYPPADYKLKPYVCYIDNQKYLMRRMDSVMASDMGEVKTVTLLKDYKKIKGMMMPQVMTMTMLGMQIDAKMVSLEFNCDIPDSDFEKPAAPVQPAQPVQAQPAEQKKP